MSSTNHSLEETEYVMIPRKELNTITELLRQVLEKVSTQPSNDISINPEYVDEKEACIIFKRKTTWFWDKRKSGELPFSKVLGKNYYKRSDILAMFDDNYTNKETKS